MTTRSRGFIEWTPRRDTCAQIEAVRVVLEEYADYLPLTIRQVFYRLVARGQIGKTERDYKNLCETLSKARRSGRIPFDHLRDDGFTEYAGFDYTDPYTAERALPGEIRHAQFDLQWGQDRRVLVWCEAGGMAPQLSRVARQYGAGVLTSGGFDSLTAKYDQACSLSHSPHLVLHIGDYDPSGVHLFSSLEEDVQAFAEGLGGKIPEFRRLAVTPEQIEVHSLPMKPAKTTDARSFDGVGTVQAEALAPDVLDRTLRYALEDALNMDRLHGVQEVCERQRDVLVERLTRIQEVRV